MVTYRVGNTEYKIPIRKKGKSCLEGIDEALMMGYDVSCRISKDGKRSVVNFNQVGERHSALRLDIEDEMMDRELNELWNENYDEGVVEYPIHSSEGASGVLRFMESLGFRVGKVV